jgi:hypothetical protein
VEVVMTAGGPSAARLELRDADGIVASWTLDGDESHVTCRYVATGPTYLVAVVSGPAGAEILDDDAFAHTSPIWLDVDGHSVARPDAVAWCLAWLDELEQQTGRHGRYAHPGQRRELVALIEQARAFYRSRLAG